MKGLADSPTVEAQKADAPAPAEHAPHRQEGGTLVYAPFVRVMTIVIVAVVIAMVALIYRQSTLVREPTSAVVIEGDPTLDGAKITVTGYGHEWKALLGPENNYITPVLLEPGHYSITITHHKKTLVHEDFEILGLHGRRYELPSAVSIVAPQANNRELRVTIVAEHGEHNPVREITLNADNRYQDIVYLPVDNYHATAYDQARIVYRDDFSVDHTKPVTVKLGLAAQTAD